MATPRPSSKTSLRWCAASTITTSRWRWTTSKASSGKLSRNSKRSLTTAASSSAKTFSLCRTWSRKGLQLSFGTLWPTREILTLVKVIYTTRMDYLAAARANHSSCATIRTKKECCLKVMSLAEFSPSHTSWSFSIGLPSCRLTFVSVYRLRSCVISTWLRSCYVWWTKLSHLIVYCLSCRE